MIKREQRSINSPQLATKESKGIGISCGSFVMQNGLDVEVTVVRIVVSFRIK